eukprot:1188549-Prorocentrum_minimum.AAC.1
MGADRRRRHQHAGPNPQVPQVRVRKLGKHPGRGNTPGPRYEGVPDPGHPEVPVSAGDPGLISPISYPFKLKPTACPCSCPCSGGQRRKSGARLLTTVDRARRCAYLTAAGGGRQRGGGGRAGGGVLPEVGAPKTVPSIP